MGAYCYGAAPFALSEIFSARAICILMIRPALYS